MRHNKYWSAATPQPPPKPGDLEVVPLVIADMKARAVFGREKHGRPLETHNGRDALMDAYQEALDQAFYLKQAILERDGHE